MLRSTYYSGFEQSNFPMFLSHQMSILLFIPDFNKVEVAFYSGFLFEVNFFGAGNPE